MMCEELKLGIEEDNSVKNGIVTFSAFLFLGIFPLIPFIIGLLINFKEKMLFYLSISVTGVTLFILGLIKTKISGGNSFKSGLESLIVGSVAASAAFVVGFVLEPLIGKKSG